MPVYYSLISRGLVVLCDYSTAGVNLEGISLTALGQLGPSDIRRCQISGYYCIYTLVELGLTYLCITDSKYEKEDAFDYLEDVKKEFKIAGLHKRALSCGLYELRIEFGDILGELTSRACGDGVSKLQTKVDTVQEVMTQNVEKLLQRGDGLDDLQGRSEELAMNSIQFQRTAGKLRRKIMWKSVKLWVVIIVIITIILVIIAVLITLVATKKI